MCTFIVKHSHKPCDAKDIKKSLQIKRKPKMQNRLETVEVEAKAFEDAKNQAAIVQSGVAATLSVMEL